MAAQRQQLLVGSGLHDTAPIEHDQAVQPGNGGEAVGNRNHGFTVHQTQQLFLNRHFHFAVQRRRGFIQNQNRRVFENHPGNGNALALPAR